VHNLYGPTEATVFSTACVVERASHAEPSIGRPISNTRAYILDGSKSSKASPVSDRQPPHLNTTLGRATLPGRATRAKCWFT